MHYAGILAGGKGTRAGNTALPKQYLSLSDGTPILIQTIAVFLENQGIDQVIIAAPEAWLAYTQALVSESLSAAEIERVHVISGGSERSESLLNICTFIETRFGLTDDDILISHDAVRPFVTQRIIDENIEGTYRYGCVDTVVPAIDTLVISDDARTIDSIPQRDKYYQGQTPQSFFIREYLETFASLSAEEQASLTDACKVYVNRGKPVHLVRGEYSNIKITTPLDVKVASSIMGAFDSTVPACSDKADA